MTDHDAHAWVEAWFAGYGWLTFDPTPGRGTALGHVHERVGLRRRHPGARHGPVPRLRAEPRRRRRRGACRALEQPSARAQPRGPTCSPSSLLVAALLGLGARQERAPLPPGRYAVTHGGAHRRPGPSSPTSCATRARARRRHAPIGELAAELRRLGVASDGFAAAFSRARYGPAAGAAAAADDARRELGRVARASPGPARARGGGSGASSPLRSPARRLTASGTMRGR